MNNINNPKKILLVFADSSVKKGLADAELLKTLLQNSANQQDLGLEIFITYARSLSYFVNIDKARIYDHKNKKDLNEYDFVYFRKAGSVMQQMLACATYLRTNKIPYFDTEIGETNSRNKLSQMFMFQEKGLPVPTTLFCRNRKRLIRLLAKDYKDEFTFPIIAKATGGTRGDANYMLKNLDELKELITNVRRHFLIQSFIPNDGDYRALVFNNKLKGLIKRTGAEGSHLNNTSKDGSAEWQAVDEFSEEMKMLAIRAAQICKRDIAGVDILVDSTTKQPYLLEVNRAPQIENASFPEKKADILAQAIIEAIDEPSVKARASHKSIGRKEYVEIKEIPDAAKVIAKVDTGAYSNSIHANLVKETQQDGVKTLSYRLLDSDVTKTTQEYFVKKVTSSNGQAEYRYVIELTLLIGGKRFAGQFTLANRDSMNYSVLIGRRFLKEHGLTVNVAKRFTK